MRRTRQDLGFVALRVEGGILPAEFVQKVVALEAKGQSGKDYRLPKGTTIKDEIGRAWRIASAEWREFRENSQRQDVDKTKLGVEQWLLTLFKVVLGHEDIVSCSVIHLGDRGFPITHKSVNGVVPLVLTTEDFRLDKTDVRFGEEGRRRSPHALMQEFLNAREECLWGMISNGRVVQLLRDNPSLTKPAYIEADLERIFEEQLYSDFAAMWLMFHGSRFACNDGKPSECLMEEWRKEGHETGERALADLRKGVTTSLRELGNGFLQASQNTLLREALKSGALSPEGYFRELLRLVYRFLFLLCVEDREQLHSSESDEKARWLYTRGYSLSRIRECALLKRNYDKHRDIWEGLQVSFHGLRQGESNLALPALGGLFVQSHCPYIEQSSIENRYLLRAVFALSFFRSGNVLARVNYRDMGTEELGSVYESLLELHPYIDVDKSPWTFDFIGEGEGTSGSERKLSGSYYTPASLVNEILRTAVDPVIEEAKRSNPDNPRRALLALKVIDPACGSGHFLLAAARRLALEIAKLDQAGEMSEEAARRHALREVVRSCIYGVDKNELALELCKTALWIEAVEPGRPLNFLDAHLRCGDSLVGILDPAVIEKGIPDEAYTALTGDDKATVSELKKQNKNDKYQHAVVQGSVFDQKSMTMLANSREHVNEMPEETIEQVEEKRVAFERWQNEASQSNEEVKANLFVGAFFAEKTKSKLTLVPRTEDLNRVKNGLAPRSGLVEQCRELAQQFNVFHWHLSFGEVFKNGGFDIVLGNPPWEKIKLQEKEFFGRRKQEIALAANKAARERLIKQLFAVDAPLGDRLLATEFMRAKRGSEATSVFARFGGRYLLCARGDINTYALFTELCRNLLNSRGRAGIIVPTGIATDDTCRLFWSDLVESKSLVSFFGFKNEEFLFAKPVEHGVVFGLLTMTGSNVKSEKMEFCWIAYNLLHMNDPVRRHVLTGDEMRQVNPNTGNCPVFRTKFDADLALSIYKRIPILIDDNTRDNAWGLSFGTMFHMSSDSELFSTSPGDGLVALYEAKMMQQYDHRYGSYESRGEDRGFATLPETPDFCYEDPTYTPKPFYYVSRNEVLSRLKGKTERQWLCGYREIAPNTNMRTAILTVLPFVGVGHKIPLVFTKANPLLVCCFLATFNSLVFDYLVRQKVGGTTVSQYILKQIPTIPPKRFSKEDFDFIVPRVLELVHTSFDMSAFANDVWVNSDERLRKIIIAKYAESNSITGGITHTQMHDSEIGPFKWNDSRRAKVRAEIDAYIATMYGLSEKELLFILDPQALYGNDFPGESFRVLKDLEIRKYGDFRTRRMTLDSYSEMSKSRSGQATV